MNLRTDPFRCRPPNTSRPPSLHVDDFVALESTGHQPTGPTGYNRISFGRGKVRSGEQKNRDLFITVYIIYFLVQKNLKKGMNKYQFTTGCLQGN